MPKISDLDAAVSVGASDLLVVVQGGVTKNAEVSLVRKPPTGTGLRKVVSGTEDAAASLLVNADVDAAAAIAGTKISSDFGSQPITTTGYISIGASPADLAQSTSGLRPPAPATDADYGNQYVVTLGDHEFELATITTLSATTPRSVFMVGEANTALAYNSLWLFAAGPPYYMFWKRDVAGLAQFFSAEPALNSTEDVTTPHAYLVEDDDTNCRLFMQSLASANVTAASKLSSSVSTFSIGKGASSVPRGQSVFAECFIVSAIMSTTEKRKLAKYVAQRYAITVPAP